MPVLLRTRGLTRRPIRPADVRHRAERMLSALGLAPAELSILLCDDATIRALNRDFRGKDRPTDVLAFAMHEGQGASVDVARDRRVLGDVVISLDTARAQARKRQRSVVDEVTMLLAHGLLHLLGYDHHTVTEERRMKARTDVLCAAAHERG